MRNGYRRLLPAAIVSLLAAVVVADHALAVTFREFPIPPEVLASSITTGRDGALWFIENIANQIGRITTDGVISEFTIPTTKSNAQIITSGPDGALWFTEFVANQIGRITTRE